MLIVFEQSYDSKSFRIMNYALKRLVYLVSSRENIKILKKCKKKYSGAMFPSICLTGEPNFVSQSPDR